MSKKILILTPGHSGSRLLVSSLNKHSQIKSNLELPPYEPLNGNFEQSWKYKDYIEKRFNINLDNYGLNIWYKNHPEIYTKVFDYKTIDHIFSNQTIIKCKYDQFRRSSILEYILKNNIKILHLSRINITSVILHVKKEFNKNTNMINMTNKKLERFFNIIVNTERSIDCLNVNSIKIYYENLINDWNYYLKKIQKFYDLEICDIIKPNKNTNKLKRSEIYSINQISESIKENYNKEYWSLEDV